MGYISLIMESDEIKIDANWTYSSGRIIISILVNQQISCKLSVYINATRFYLTRIIPTVGNWVTTQQTAIKFH